MTMTTTRTEPDRLVRLEPRAAREVPPGRIGCGWAERHLGLLTVLTAVLATGLSLANAWHVSMWVDEAYTVTVATRPLADLWRMVHRIDIVHALYNLLLHPWLAVAGVSGLSVRLPSAVSVGVATVGVVVLGRQLFHPRVALVAGLVFAVLPRVTGAGIDGRSYALTVAVAVWMTVLLVDLLRRPTPGKHVGYALLAGFGGALNIFLVLLLAAHGAALLLERRYRFTRLFWSWAAAAAAAFAAALPVLLTAVRQSAQIGPSSYSPLQYVRAVAVNQWFLAETPTIYLSGGGLIGESPRSQAWAYAAVLLAAVCWLLVGTALLAGRRLRRFGSPVSFRPLLLAWIALPTLLMVGYALLASPLYNPRYLSFGAPAVALLVAAGMVTLGRWPGWPGRSGALALVLVVLLAAPVYASQRTVYGKGADWSAVAAFVERHPGPGRAVYFAPRSPTTVTGSYTTGRTAQTLYPDAFAGVRDLTLVSSAAAEGDLLGRSQPLAASADRLQGIQEVFVVTRRDYPAEVLRRDTAVLDRAGFRPGEVWTGPLNTVTDFRRAPGDGEDRDG